MWKGKKVAYALTGALLFAAAALAVAALRTFRNPPCENAITLDFSPELSRLGNYEVEIAAANGYRNHCRFSVERGEHLPIEAPAPGCSGERILVWSHEKAVLRLEVRRVLPPVRVRITEAGSELFTGTVKASDGTVTEHGCWQARQHVVLRFPE